APPSIATPFPPPAGLPPYRPGRGAAWSASGGVERLLEVGDEVLGVFEADREADHAVGDAAAPPLPRVHVAVAGGHRLGDEAFDAAEAGRDREQPQPVDHGGGLLGGGVQDRAEHAAAAAHLLLDDPALLAGRQPRVVD